MSHYEKRLERDLDQIRHLITEFGEVLEEAVRGSVQALITHDEEKATEIILGDIAINAMSRELDHRCHAFVARHVPSASHLRLVSSVLRLSIALERIGDYCEGFCRSTLQLTSKPSSTVIRDINLLGDLACRLLRESVKAFAEGNGDMAKGTIATLGHFGTTFDQVFADLVREGEKERLKIHELFLLLTAFTRLDRIIRQSKNICEETIFVATGEIKGPKTYSLLFVDRENAGASQLAEHLARKAYPEVGQYRSAGIEPAGQVIEAFQEYADGKGLDLHEARPTSLTETGSISESDVVVALEPGLRKSIGRLPYDTVLVTWPLENPGDPEAVHHQLVEHLSDLTSKIHGAGA